MAEGKWAILNLFMIECKVSVRLDADGLFNSQLDDSAGKVMIPMQAEYTELVACLRNETASMQSQQAGSSIREQVCGCAQRT